MASHCWDLTHASATLSPSELLLAERYSFLGSLIATLAYGALLMLYVQLVGVLFARPQRGQAFWAIVTYSLILFSLATVVVGTVFEVSEKSYVDNRNFQGGPYAFYLQHCSDHVNVLGEASAAVFIWIADILMLVRIWVIWNSWGWVITVPLLIYFAKLALSIPFLIVFVRTSAPGWSSSLTTAYNSLNFAFNAYITLIICIRLLMLRPQLEAVSGKLHASFYTSTITVFVESGGFFTIWSAVYLIIRSRSSFVTDVFFFPQSFTLGVTRMSLILRIAQNRAWSRELVQSVHRGVLDWEVSSTQSIPLHDVPSTSDFRRNVEVKPAEKLHINFSQNV